MLFYWNVEVTGTSIFLLKLFNGLALFFESLENSIGDASWAIDIVSLLGLGNVQSVQNSLLLLWVLCLLSQAMVQKNVARFALHICNTISRNVRHIDQISIGLSGEVLDFLALRCLKLVILLQIALSKDKDERLGLEKRLDRCEQRNLLVNSVTT